MRFCVKLNVEAMINQKMQGKKMNSKKNNLKIKLCTLLFAILLVISSVIPVYATAGATNGEVILGGCLFGVKMQTNGVVIVGINKIEGVSPAIGAGLKQGDVIKIINGKGIANSEDVLKMITGSNGHPLNITVQRGNESKKVTLTPKLDSDNKYRAGILIRDSAAGIGTVTYIDPKTSEFAGLGHGICDSDTASLLPLSRGIVTEVDLIEVAKGKCGAPGEIKGAFKGSKIGSLTNNTSNGVYGIYSSLPSCIGRKIKVADYSEIKDGKATIRCSVSGKVEEYEIQIKRLNKNEKGKNFSVKVTDPSLIAISGGIVQGMSGSPIIQNGKLIGAVTHVTVNEPTEGYGIFIGNMLSAAQGEAISK